MGENKILGGVFFLGIILVIISFIKSDIPGPSDWLVGWTTWIGTVVGIVVAARVFWIGGNTIRNYFPKTK